MSSLQQSSQHFSQQQQQQQTQPSTSAAMGSSAAQQLAALFGGGAASLLMPSQSSLATSLYSPANISALQAAMAAAAMQQHHQHQTPSFPVVPDSALSALQTLLGASAGGVGSGLGGIPGGLAGLPGFAQTAVASPFAAMLGQQQQQPQAQPQQQQQQQAQQQQAQQQQQLTQHTQQVPPQHPLTMSAPSLASTPVSAGEAAAAAAAAASIGAPSMAPDVATLAAAAAVTLPSSDEDDDDDDEPVRKEKVEAALRSKPQRGRKRDNLSAIERQELTRTRNREHAKSTRIRKKARYQELLAVEQKYQMLEAIERLRMERCKILMDFISLRTNMLRRAAPSPDSDDDATKEQAQDSDGPLLLDPARFPSTLCDFVSDLDDFKFNAVSVSADHQQNRNLSSASRLLLWDQQISRRIRRSWGADGLGSASFEIVGGAEGIAISHNSSGSARVNIILNSHQGKTIMSGVLSFQFAPDSCKLRSVEWCTINDALTFRSRKRRRAAEYASIAAVAAAGDQASFPSIVSLPSNASPARSDGVKSE